MSRFQTVIKLANGNRVAFSDEAKRVYPVIECLMFDYKTGQLQKTDGLKAIEENTDMMDKVRGNIFGN